MESKHELDELKGIVNYRGVNVMRIVGGFRLFGMNVSTAKEVDELIEMGYESIQQSIVRGSVTVLSVGGSFSCTVAPEPLNPFGKDKKVVT